MTNIEDCDTLIDIAFRGIIAHYQAEPGITGIKLITTANDHVLQVCMDSFSKFMDSKK